MNPQDLIDLGKAWGFLLLTALSGFAAAEFASRWLS